MREFKIAQPKTVDELAALLAETEDKLALMAGGTDLIDELKSGVAAPDTVVDIQGIEALAGIARDKDGLRLGPLTRVVDLAENPVVAEDYPILKEAALSLATPQLRNVGTVGGNLCQRPRCWYYRDPEVVCRKKGGAHCFAFRGRNKYHAIMGGSGCFIVYPSDLAPALIGLAAKVTVGSASGDKVMPLEEFYKPPSVDVSRENVLGRDEFLKSILVPGPKPGQKGAYVKLKERGTWDFAIASAAAVGVVKSGTLAEISIVAGGVAPVPWRMKKAEDILRGKPITESLARQAAEEALKDATPLAENAYKKDLAAVAVRRAVLALLQR
jgi:xanthine dehydrogenase YagS FAD-binding subunit